jgi:hypothetical protein
LGNKDFFKWATLYTVIIAIGAIVLLNAWAAWHGLPVGGVRYAYALVLAAIFGTSIAIVQNVMLNAGESIFLGTSATPVPHLTLSRVRALMKQEAWPEAREEIDRLWAVYPGNGEILREYEHILVDHMHAPSAFAEFLAKAVPALKGKDRAYAMFRLAELHAGELDRKMDATFWCHRLLVEHPDSHLAKQGRDLLESLPSPEKPPKA